MKINNEIYTISIELDESLNTEPSEMELRLVLQYLPELHADMIRLLNLTRRKGNGSSFIRKGVDNTASRE